MYKKNIFNQKTLRILHFQWLKVVPPSSIFYFKKYFRILKTFFMNKKYYFEKNWKWTQQGDVNETKRALWHHNLNSRCGLSVHYFLQKYHLRNDKVTDPLQGAVWEEYKGKQWLQLHPSPHYLVHIHQVNWIWLKRMKKYTHICNL